MIRLLHPPVFQGSLKSKSYFEGWYVKCLYDDLLSSVAFIPGISLSHDRHAFIQVNTSGGATQYLKFPIEDFHYSSNSFDVRVGDNRFNARGIHLSIDRPEISLHGDLSFEDIHAFPSTLIAPGIMGWFTFVPFMECYHGVVSIRHRIKGNLRLNDHEHTFKNGIGYIEKDWGRSFPESWIWMQANPFQNSDASFMFSVARIPWMGSWFSGLIGFLYHDGKLERFATYLGHRTRFLELGKRDLHIGIGGRGRYLRIHAETDPGGDLIAPVNGVMRRSMKESLNSFLHVELKDKRNNVLFNDSSHIAGLEISGNMDHLFKKR
ncbi:MAG: tocopherol cyclase family protein [FCB group bacterium]|nr:tocopherol cyclase family protein [FCB group bacterium]